MKFLNQIDGAKDLVEDSAHRLVTDTEKTTWNEKDQIPLVIGTQTATTASWTGVASTVDSLYNGLTIRYWLPQTSASNVTLNLTLKGGGTTGAINCYYRGTSRLTTHYTAGNLIIMTYLVNALIGSTQYTGWWAHSQYVDGTESYAVRWNAAVKVGVEVTQYKLLVQGVDGKYYPTLIGNTTAGTKTVSTVPFLIGAPIIFYGTTATVAANALTSATYNYTAITTSSTSYAFNQTSGFLANADLYLKGTIVGATFILDNTTLTSHLTQTLPTTEDGFFYKRLGVSTNTTTGFRLTLQHPIYYFADGQLQSLDSSQIADWGHILNKPAVFPPDTHTHLKAQVTDLGNLAGISTNASTSNYLRGDGTWVTPPNTVYTHPTTAGNKHIPTGGASGQVLKYSASGTATWQADSDTITTINGKTGAIAKADITALGIPAQDTVYTHPASHPASMITGLPTGKKVARFVVGTSTAGWTAADCDYLCDGTADETEINAAIIALPATGGEVVILDGTYNITVQINVTKDNVSIRGNGNATILKRMSNSSSGEGVITLASRSGCKISNLQVDGNDKVGFGIRLDSSSNNTVTGNICTSNQYSGIGLLSSSNNTITGNTFNNNNESGIHLYDSSNNNTVTSNICNNNSNGIYLYASSNNNTVTGNTFNNNESGIFLYDLSKNNTVTGNTSNNNYFGINLNNSNNNVVTGNACNNNSSGIHLNSSSYNTVTGNTCIRGTGLTTDYTQDDYTIRVYGIGGIFNNLISNNNCMGKAPVIEGGVANTIIDNKWSFSSGRILENYTEKLTTVIASGGSIDLSLGNVFVHTPSGNRTYSITNAVSGQAHSFTLIINMGSTVRTLTFPSSVKWQGGEIPDLTTASKTYVLTFMTVNGGTTWLGMFGGEF